MIIIETQKDREFVEQDLVEAQLNQQTNADNQPQALSLSKKLKMAAKASPSSDCLYSCCRLRRRTRQNSRVDSGSRKSDPAGEWELNDIESQQQQHQHQQGQRSQQQHPLIRPSHQHQHQQQQPGPSTSKSGSLQC